METKRLMIRQPRPEDVDAIIRIEAICFPAAEAAKAEDIRIINIENVSVIADYFLISDH